MTDKRVELLRRLAQSTTFEGERESALAKAAELEARMIPPPPQGPPRPPAGGIIEYPDDGSGFWGITASTTASNSFVVQFVTFIHQEAL